MTIRTKRQAERLGSIKSRKLLMPQQYEKIMLLVVKKLTNLLIFSLFLLVVHHPKKTAQAVENYNFSMKETNHSSVVFISE